MLEGVYLALDKVFGPLVTNAHPMWVVTISGIILGAFFTLVNHLLIDQEKMKKLQKMSKNSRRSGKRLKRLKTRKN